MSVSRARMRERRAARSWKGQLMSSPPASRTFQRPTTETVIRSAKPAELGSRSSFRLRAASPVEPTQHESSSKISPEWNALIGSATGGADLHAQYVDQVAA